MKINRKWILGTAIILTIIGGFLARWHLWAIDLFRMISEGRMPETEVTGVALGGVLLVFAPILFQMAKHMEG